MSVNNILHIIKEGENENVEFKQSFNRQVIETVVALANHKGGYVIIGVTDQSNIVGVDVSNESIQNWQNEIKSKTEPAVFPNFETFVIEHKNVVVIMVQQYPVKPVAFQGRYFIRRKNSNHLLVANEINDLYLHSIQTSWDSYAYPNAKFDDLDVLKMEHFIERINQNGRFRLSGTPFECLTKLRLLKNETPTNAAMLLFSKEERYINVHIGRFKTQSHIIDDKMVRGTLFDAVENTMIFIISHLKVAFEITGKTSQRTEIFEYPLPALRELILNAIVHRDYTSPTDIQIKIFDNQITIFNPGKLYGGLTIDELKTDNYQSQSRNKLISEAFYLTNEIEKYGSGFRRVRDQIAQYPNMYFEFSENSGGFLIKIGYHEQDRDENVTENVTEKRLLQIITFVELHPKITTIELSKKLNITRMTLHRELEKLKELGKIRRNGPDKGGFWEILK